MAITDDEIDAAAKRSEASRTENPKAIAARYDATSGLVEIAMANGAFFSFPPRLAQALQGATIIQLKDVEILGAGTGLHFPAIDADLYIPALIEGVFGSKAWMASRMGQQGGLARTDRKASAARANGKLGGRPRKAG